MDISTNPYYIVLSKFYNIFYKNIAKKEFNKIINFSSKNLSNNEFKLKQFLNYSLDFQFKNDLSNYTFISEQEKEFTNTLLTHCLDKTTLTQSEFRYSFSSKNNIDKINSIEITEDLYYFIYPLIYYLSIDSNINPNDTYENNLNRINQFINHYFFGLESFGVCLPFIFTQMWNIEFPLYPLPDSLLQTHSIMRQCNSIQTFLPYIIKFLYTEDIREIFKHNSIRTINNYYDLITDSYIYLSSFIKSLKSILQQKYEIEKMVTYISTIIQSEIILQSYPEIVNWNVDIQSHQNIIFIKSIKKLLYFLFSNNVSKNDFYNLIISCFRVAEQKELIEYIIENQSQIEYPTIGQLYFSHDSKVSYVHKIFTFDEIPKDTSKIISRTTSRLSNLFTISDILSQHEFIHRLQKQTPFIIQRSIFNFNDDVIFLTLLSNESSMIQNIQQRYEAFIGFQNKNYTPKIISKGICVICLEEGTDDDPIYSCCEFNHDAGLHKKCLKKYIKQLGNNLFCPICKRNLYFKNIVRRKVIYWKIQ